VTPVDWIILGAVLLLALFGWAQGFLTGALSLLGFALGAFLGTRLGPHLLPDGSQSPYAPLFGLLGALVAGAILATGFEGIGSRLRGFLRIPGLGALDGALGALLMACLGLGVAWVVGAVALQTPGARELRRDIQRSAILARLNEVLPSRELLNALARFDPFPRISGPDIDVAAPDGDAPDDPEVRAAAASVVKIHGTACGLGVEGSGWVARPGVVVTNAHVVAGMDDALVLPGGQGAGLAAEPVHFDARNDIAVLRVPGLGAPALALAPRSAPGTAGAILGFPLDGPYRVRPARLGRTGPVLTQDAYGRGPLRRSITAIRGRVQSGNSGGPVVDLRGRVVTTVFAATTSGPRGGYGVPVRVVRRALRGARAAVSTGPCAR
jgi:S1-C subfamily serine protease